MKKYVDLHTHTYYSDGIISPTHLLCKAVARKVGFFSITDHNTMGAYSELEEVNQNAFPKIINGCEFTAIFAEKQIHILGYGIDKTNEQLKNYFDYLQKIRTQRFKFYFNYLNAKNIIFPKQIYKTILTKKYGSGMEAVKNQLFLYNIPFDFDTLKEAQRLATKLYPSQKKSTKEIISLIHQSGGLAVLAHPFKYGFDNIDFAVSLLKDLKLDGLECYHSSASEEMTDYFLYLAKKYSLLVTGGSDAHSYFLKQTNSRELVYGKNNNLCLTPDKISKEILEL